MATKASKEAVSALSTTETVVKQSTEATIINLPCALPYFFRYALTAWGYCRDHLDLFFGESDRFTKEFINAQILLINEGKMLPDFQARITAASTARETLIARRQEVGSMAKRLRSAIGYAFKDEKLAELELKLAGFDDFISPNSEDWGSVSKFIDKGNNYLNDKGELLLAAMAIKGNFKELFSAKGSTFEAAWADFIAKEKAAYLGTKTMNDALEAILEELNPMLELGKVIFEFDAVNRKQFTINDLVNEVRGKDPAGVSGFVRLTGAPRPTGLAGIRVGVVGLPDKFAITDKRGKYELSLAAGTFDIEFTSPAYLPYTFPNKKLNAGTTSRLNVELSPVPVEVAAASTPDALAEVAPDILDNQLSSAMTDMMNTSVPATNGVVG